MTYISDPIFPNSANDPFLETSPTTPNYNCIAWAFGDERKWYWPDDSGFAYWPENIPREVNLDAFIALYELNGYEVCENGNLESGVQKIAIFAQGDKPTHAAKQLENGKWSSKLGEAQDVEHSIQGISGGLYGNVAVYMRKKVGSNKKRKNRKSKTVIRKEWQKRRSKKIERMKRKRSRKSFSI